MTDRQVTVAFVPREVFSTTERALETLFARTRMPFELVCVDGGSPPDVSSYLETKSREKNFTLLRVDNSLTPTQARNLATRYVRTPYVAYLDNDALVGDGWLRPLVDCAEQTGAWVVAPLYFEHLPEQHRVHMAGGECEIRQDAAGRRFKHEKHHHQHTLLQDIAAPIERHETELIEFHALLVAMDAFDRVGPLDEQLFSHAEHADFSMSIRAAGGRLFLEPRSRVTHVPPPRLSGEDWQFFMLRWSEAWCMASMNRLASKWSLSREHGQFQNSIDWLRLHRRYGSRTLACLRQWLGQGITNCLQVLALNRADIALNRYLYPLAEYQKLPPVDVRVVHQPTPVAKAA